MKNYKSQNEQIEIFNADFQACFKAWKSPVVIISDGPYGIGGFPGDPNTPEKLAEIYRPFIKIWTDNSTPLTTLWFWNTELGWAKVHSVFEEFGWEFVNCHIWDKGLGHIAGNANTKTLRKLPVVTEVCVQYIKKPFFKIGEEKLLMKEWLRREWLRTGLPLTKTNEACGVKNAATRKYFTKCDLWYFPPEEAFEKFVTYANTYGKQTNKPYFSINGHSSLTKDEWRNMRAKFTCPFGITNVWNEPPLNGVERIKNGARAIHLNQKPLKLIKLIIGISSEEGDVVWEPFGGLCTGAIAAHELKRICFSSEISSEVYHEAIKRFKSFESIIKLGL